MSKPSVAIVTCYHFNNRYQQAYLRLLRSLCASLQQLECFGPNCRLVLVANGIEEGDDGAMPPDKVIKAVKAILPTFKEDLFYPCSLKQNLINTGGLNKGIDAALHSIPEVEWIASVQSSAVIKEGWLENLLGGGSIHDSVGAAFGRILIEEHQNLIWTDGHLLKKGLTLDVNSGRSTEEKRLPPGQFPCLSAAIFRRSLVEKIWNAYGNFVCENLCHYGDCTDVALRARTLDPSVLFKYSDKAIALKRKPTQNQCRIEVSQLLAASLYYSQDHRERAEVRLREKGSSHLESAIRDVQARLRKSYAPKRLTAPRGMLLDAIW
jgi:hypothetical protein